MRTFWIYFFIFLCLSILTQAFLYFSGSEQYNFDIIHSVRLLVLTTATAFLASYILRKKKNPYKRKANSN